MTKDEAQRRRWTFYEAVKIEGYFIFDPRPPVFLSSNSAGDPGTEGAEL
jgi:hypothetical protein